jgi:hypothetical protein
MLLDVDNHFYFMTVSSGLNSASLNVFQIYKDNTLLRHCKVFKLLFFF